MKTFLNNSGLPAVMVVFCLSSALPAADPPRTNAPRLLPRPIPGMTSRPTTPAPAKPHSEAPVAAAGIVVPESGGERARIVAIHRRSGALTAKAPNDAAAKSAATSDDNASTVTSPAPGRVRIIPREEATKLAAQGPH